MRLVEQVEAGGICWPVLEIQCECLLQRCSVPLGLCLQITEDPADAQESQHRNQQ